MNAFRVAQVVLFGWRLHLHGEVAKHRFIVEEVTKVGIERLEDNLKAPVIEDLALDQSDYDNSHLLSEDRSPACRFLKTKKSRFVRSNKAA